MKKIGMVGVGCISGIYLKNFKNVFKDVELVAVCDLIRERAEKAQAEYGIPKIYDTMHELFADSEIDIVLNLTRPISILKFPRLLCWPASMFILKSPWAPIWKKVKNWYALPRNSASALREWRS